MASVLSSFKFTIGPRSWIVIATLLVIGLLFGAYFGIYIPIREDELVKRGFRVLGQMADNITARNYDYYKLAEKKLFLPQEVKQKALENSCDDLQQKKKWNTQVNQTRLKIIQNINSIKEVLNQRNKLNISSTARMSELAEDDKTRIELEQETIQVLQDSLRVYKRQIKRSNDIINNKLNLLLQQKIGGEIQVQVKPTNRQDFINYEQTIKQDSCHDTNMRSDTTISLYLLVPFAEFMNPILRMDAFDEFLIVRKDSILYQTMKNKVELESQHADSLLITDGPLRAGNVMTMKSSNQDYKVLVHKMVFENHLQAKFESWYICGLIKEDRYNQEVRQVESFVLINAGVVLLFILMGMPLLKLKLMSPIERLYISNVIWVGVSLVFGISLLILSFLSAYNFVELKYSYLNEQLEKLSNAVMLQFKQELNEIYHQLEFFDSTTTLDCPETIKLTKSYSLAHTTFVPDSVRSINDSLKLNADFNYLFWINANGDITNVISPYDTSGFEGLKVNIAERAYFRDIAQKRTWTLPNSSDKEFAMQSILSWADNTLELGVSKSSNNCEVVALTTKPYSVMDPVLAPGYGFAVIDDKGLVLFHSDSKNNLQENFLEETDNNDVLTSAISGKITKLTSVTYLKKWHRVYTRPIGETPLSLLVFYDLDYLKAPIVQSIMTTFYLICFLFLLVVLVLFIIFIYRYRYKKLQIKRFYLKWMNPKKKLRTRYQLLFAGNLVIILFWLVLGIIADGRHHIWEINLLDQVFLVTVTPLGLLVFNYLMLTRPKSKLLVNVFSLSLALLNLFYLIYFSRPIKVCALLMLLQLFYMAFLWVLYRLKNFEHLNDQTSSITADTTKIITSWIENLNLQKSYNYFLLSWLVISSFIPVLFYFKFASGMEQQIWKKHAQLEVAKAVNDRTNRLLARYNSRLIDTTGRKLSDHMYLNIKQLKGEYHNHLGYSKTELIPADKELTRSNLDTILFYLRPGFDPLTTDTRPYAFHHAGDTLWKWFQSPEDILKLSYQLGPVAKPTILTSDLKKSTLHLFMCNQNLKFAIILWLLLIITLVGLYKVIQYAVRKIYAQDYIQVHCYELIEPDFLKKREINNRVFITGLPYSGKWKLISKYETCLRQQRIPYQILDCRNLAGRGKVFGPPEDSQVVIIENFEYQINDHECLRAKLELLQSLLSDRSKQIVISSEVNPQQILNYYRTMINKTNVLQFQQSFRDEYEQYRHHSKLWQQILRGFVKLYYHLTEESVTLSGKYYNKIDKVVESELKHGTYLGKLEPLVMAYYNNLTGTGKKHQAEEKDLNISKDDIILKIQSLAESYYHSIWNSFSRSEKSLIFDLAKDRFVNVKNESAIENLLRKGVFRYKNNLKLMNTSFNNFVLNVVDSDQEMIMERELRKKGKWSIIQIVLILVIISITIFIVLGQKNFLNQFNSLVGAIAAVMGLLLRFGGVFTQSPSGAKSDL